VRNPASATTRARVALRRQPRDRSRMRCTESIAPEREQGAISYAGAVAKGLRADATAVRRPGVWVPTTPPGQQASTNRGAFTAPWFVGHNRAVDASICRERRPRPSSSTASPERSSHTGTIDDVRELMGALLVGELSPQETSKIICAEALGRESGPWPWLWLLWAALSAPCGTGRAATRRAEADMRRAAREWLELSSGEAQWRAYFDRWLQEILGWRKATGTQTVAGVMALARGGSGRSVPEGTNGDDPRLGRSTIGDAVSRRSAQRRDCK
jgi:hypothetical protein